MNEADRQIERVEGREAFREKVIQLIALARREILVASAELDPALFRNGDLIDALRQQLLHERRLKIRILISNPRAGRRHADRLIELMRRLPSQFLIHEPSKPEYQFEHEIWTADNLAFVKRESPHALFASCGVHAPADTHVLRERFEEDWHNSVSTPEFRQLS